MSGFVVTTDPSVMERIFTTDDALPSFSEMSKERLVDLERVDFLLSRIPKIEADCIRMAYFKGKTQTDIARIFKIKQPAVHYRIRRGMTRLRFLLTFPSFELDEMRADLAEAGMRDDDIDILVEMYQTTCQSEVANRLNLTQGMVRHRFLKSVEFLVEEADDKYEDYARAFRSIQDNCNILHEIKPQHPFS